MITITAISKFFGEITALENINLEINEGDAVVIRGPSGSGKSTLLRLIAGLEIPDEGEIWLHGQLASTPQGVTPPHQRRVGMLFQRNALWPHLTVYQNVTFGLKGLPKDEIVEKAQKIMTKLKVSDLVDRFPGKLSGGQARRAALARTLVTEPEILLLDEPLTNLDPGLKEELLSILVDYAHDAKYAIIYVTHNQAEQENIPGQKYSIIGGRLHVV